MDSVMESNTCPTICKNVTEINICLASPKRCHRKRHINSEVRGVMERRHGKRPVERHGKAVTECVTESMTQAASRTKLHGKRRGRCDVMIVNSLV